MIFKPKFFLDLSGNDGGKAAEPVTIAPVAPVAPAAAKAKAPAESSPKAPGPAADAPKVESTPAPAASGMTTAEAIAAELAAAQASRPAPTLSSFAPECLVPGGATPTRRRRGGANLAAFKEIARSYLKA